MLPFSCFCLQKSLQKLVFRLFAEKRRAVKAVLRAGIHAFSASDAFRRTGDLTDRQAHRTGVLTGFAGSASFLFPADLHQTEPVEPAVNGSQRTEILAERTVNLDGKQEKGRQDAELPEEQSSDLTAQRTIGCQKRQCAEKRAGRTEVFAEGRNFGKAAEQKQRTDAYKQQKNCVFSIF